MLGIRGVQRKHWGIFYPEKLQYSAVLSTKHKLRMGRSWVSDSVTQRNRCQCWVSLLLSVSQVKFPSCACTPTLHGSGRTKVVGICLIPTLSLLCLQMKRSSKTILLKPVKCSFPVLRSLLWLNLTNVFSMRETFSFV